LDWEVPINPDGTFTMFIPSSRVAIQDAISRGERGEEHWGNFTSAQFTNRIRIVPVGSYGEFTIYEFIIADAGWTPDDMPIITPVPPIGEVGHIPQFIYTNTSRVGIFLRWSTNPFNRHGYRVFRASSATAAGISISDFAFQLQCVGTSISTLDINVRYRAVYYYYVREVLEEARFDASTSTLIPEVLGPPSTRVRVEMVYVPVGGGGGEDDDDQDQQAQYGFIMMFIGDPMMNVNGALEEIDPGVGTAPVIIGARTMVPIRAIVEAMGGTVGWDGDERRIDLWALDSHVRMWLGRSDVLVNGDSRYMDVVPEIINDRTLIPVRFVAEFLGAHIEWIGSQQMVVIVYPLS